MRSSDLLLRATRTLGLSATALLVPALAQATPSFPDTIARELQLAAPPPCSICHAGGDTRRGTVTTPFGTTMRARGLVAYSDASVATALKALDAERKDSDRDGVSDVDELRAGTDPNLVSGEALPDPPVYGCVTARSTTPDAGWLVVIGAVLARVLRRGRPKS